MAEYTDMTDEEYDALDNELSQNPPRIISNGNDWLSLRELRISGLENMTIQYLLTKAKATNKTPVQIIDEMVREKLILAV